MKSMNGIWNQITLPSNMLSTLIQVAVDQNVVLDSAHPPFPVNCTWPDIDFTSLTKDRPSVSRNVKDESQVLLGDATKVAQSKTNNAVMNCTSDLPKYDPACIHLFTTQLDDKYRCFPYCHRPNVS